ncbi:MAG: 4Fe-4S binding protein [Armatimonadetes bacterium]|nr:4Fe-4S binding protein [Armatimonadota bacterium]MDW8121749.1 4Fe-4S binding protein [Armatimonadota bacterium]
MTVAEEKTVRGRVALRTHLSAQNFRRAFQLLSLGLFLVLFFAVISPLRATLPLDAYLRLSLLNYGSAALSARDPLIHLLPWALVVLVATLLLGRVFCGWMCPLGVVIDISDRFFEKRTRRSLMRERRWRNLKYYLLIFVVVSALFGVQVAFLFDPIALLTRALTLAFYPPLHLGIQILGSWASVAGEGLKETIGWLFPEGSLHYRMGIVAFLIFIGIIAANALSPRFWCRYLCPLGALLGLLSRFAVLRKRVSEACDRCRVCCSRCRMQAIDSNTIRTDPAECVLCLSCVATCPMTAIRYGWHLGDQGPSQWASEVEEPKPRLVRRRLVFSGLAGLTWAALARTNAGAERSVRQQPIASPFLLRPPGAAPEEDFLSRCIRCSLCIKVCPTGGLQPAIGEAGLEGFWTPVLVPRMGECAPQCTDCYRVCPTQAIQPFTAEEKSWLYIGTAVIDRSLCIVWNSQKQCLVCDEVCTYRAIEWRDREGIPHPFVNDHLCVGCGLCEVKCPVQPQAAIRVYSFGDKRSWSREKQKRWRELGVKQKQDQKGY